MKHYVRAQFLSRDGAPSGRTYTYHYEGTDAPIPGTYLHTPEGARVYIVGPAEEPPFVTKQLKP